jgi:hypothetical protein
MAMDKPDGMGATNGPRFAQTFVIRCTRVERGRSTRIPYYTDLPPMAELNANRMPAFVNRQLTTPSNCGPSSVSPIAHFLAELDALLLSENTGWQGRLPTQVRSVDTVHAQRPPFAATAIVAVLSAGVVGSLFFYWSDKDLPGIHSEAAKQAVSITAAVEPRSRSIVVPPTARPNPDPTPNNRFAPPSEIPAQLGTRTSARPADRTNAVMPVSLTTDLNAAAVDPYAGRVAKPLTGDALELARTADRIATKELNLQQLDRLRRASETSTGAERSGT